MKKNRSYFSVHSEKSNVQESTHISMERYVFGAHIKAWKLMQEKKNRMLKYLMKGEEQGNPDYEGPKYIREICETLQSFFARITHNDREDISVFVFYQFPEEPDTQWHKVAVLGEQEKGSETEIAMLQCELLMDKVYAEESSSFYEKSSKRHKRDSFGTYLCFSSCEQTYVQGAVIVTAGENGFQYAEEYCLCEDKTFQDALVFSIFPYFVQLLETELGFAYMRERKK